MLAGGAIRWRCGFLVEYNGKPSLDCLSQYLAAAQWRIRSELEQNTHTGTTADCSTIFWKDDWTAPVSSQCSYSAQIGQICLQPGSRPRHATHSHPTIIHFTEYALQARWGVTTTRTRAASARRTWRRRRRRLRPSSPARSVKSVIKIRETYLVWVTSAGQGGGGIITSSFPSQYLKVSFNLFLFPLCSNLQKYGTIS